MRLTYTGYRKTTKDLNLDTLPITFGVLGTAVGVAWIGSAGTVIGPLAGISTAVSVELEKQKWEEKEQNQQNKSDIEEKGGAMK